MFHENVLLQFDDYPVVRDELQIAQLIRLHGI